jgi:hypothetical protein
MRKKHWVILAGIGLISAVAIAAMWLACWPIEPSIDVPKHSPAKHVEPKIDVTLLTHEKSIVGNWRRVDLDEHGYRSHGWRQIHELGKMWTLYGDIIFDGSYKLIDKKTIETSYHFWKMKDEVNQWTFGFLDGRLIMIHNNYGWVEKYEQVPAGVLYPSYDP